MNSNHSFGYSVLLPLEPTCQSQLKCAEVAAKLVTGRDHQLPHVRALDTHQPQRVVVVVGHTQLTRPGLVHQSHAPPDEDRRQSVRVRTGLKREKTDPML